MDIVLTALPSSLSAFDVEMMASPTLSYSSPLPVDGHTPIGSPLPSQILLHRVASPNHLVAQQQHFVDSPRSVPHEFSQYSAPSDHFEFEQAHTPNAYLNEEPQMYEFNANGAMVVDPQFAEPQPSVDQRFLYAVYSVVKLANASRPLCKYNLQLLCTANSQTTSTIKSNTPQ
jgi:hypothetical protein